MKEVNPLQSRRMELPASTIPMVLQRFQKSMCSVQLSKSGKYASGKKVALNTLILSNVVAPSARLFNSDVYIAKFYCYDVFSATILPEAYLPGFDSCTKHIVFWKRWSTGGIVEAGSSVLPDWNWHLLLPIRILPITKNLDSRTLGIASRELNKLKL